MSKVIPIGGWVNFSGGGGGGGVSLKFRGIVKKRQSPDFRSPEVGISVYEPRLLHFYRPVDYADEIG